MLGDLAEHTTMPERQDAKPISVRLTTMSIPLGLPPQLFSFSLTPITRSGTSEAPPTEEEATAVMIANQPLSLIREVALRFLFSLVARAPHVEKVSTGKASLDELPDLINDSETESAFVSWESLSYDWTKAADAVKERAAARGLRLSIRHTPNIFESLEEINLRLPSFRRLYREDMRIHQWIDNVVAHTASADFSIRGGHEQARILLQQQSTVATPTQFLAQAIRDSLVYGNGYLRHEMHGLDFSARCFHADRVSVDTAERMTLRNPDGNSTTLPSTVQHFRGAEQLSSPYGVSALEPLLFALQQRDLIAERRRLEAQVPDALRHRLTASSQFADQMEAGIQERIGQLTSSLDLVPREIPEDLYFPGQENL